MPCIDDCWYTMTEKKPMSTINKSAFTDHPTTKNHIIDWAEATTRVTETECNS